MFSLVVFPCDIFNKSFLQHRDALTDDLNNSHFKMFLQTINQGLSHSKSRAIDFICLYFWGK